MPFELIFPIVAAIAAVFVVSGMNRSVQCPKCGQQQPKIRTPSTWRQTVWGGWTCQKCGQEMDRRGKAVTAKS